ncbi:MAG: TonB-dependent receptor [Ignavibacteria bacterium]
MKKFLLVIWAVSLMFNYIYAQTSTGKLAGKVTDARTGDPLPGANVLIVGTELGAATNAKGEYFIINVVPGTYDVRVSFVGYATQIIKDVRIVAGITKELNIALEEATAELKEITVTSQRTFFEQKATNTVKVIDKEEISRVPVRGVQKIAALNAGVVMAEGSGGVDGNATINVKGGRGNEVLYIIDGVVQNDPYWNTAYTQVSNSAIEQISFQIGGFEAKYGQAQSGIINVTTKSGSSQYSVFGDVLTSTFTDKFGYNLYTLNIGGPFVPNQSKHTFFLSAERGWFLDQDPPAIPIEFKTPIRTAGDIVIVDPVTGNKQVWTPGMEIPAGADIRWENVAYSNGKTYEYRPHNTRGTWRFSGKTYHDLGIVTLRLGAIINTINRRIFDYSYVKNNSYMNPVYEQQNYSYSARISQNLGANAFWNLNFGYKIFKDKQTHPIFGDDLEKWGDTLYNPFIKLNGFYQGAFFDSDSIGIFSDEGSFDYAYSKNANYSYQIDFDFTSQIGKHLIEFGVGAQLHELHRYSISPMAIARNIRAPGLIKDKFTRYKERIPFYWGYNIYGDSFTEGDSVIPPKKPIIAYGYIQDRFELPDLVINFGLRFDYLNSKSDVIRDPQNPFKFGDPQNLDPEDFEPKKPEFHISPRLGIGFPVTATTVFHAQYGKFIQAPSLADIFTWPRHFQVLLTDGNRLARTGLISSEVTTQYELGFRQILGDNVAALGLTAFYKNTKGLINWTTTVFYRPTGEQNTYYGPSNADFGTIKGLTLTLDLARYHFIALSVNYTYQIAEGTGSSTSSSYVATFRNPDNSVPKVIAPLDFDQRHTGTVIVDVFIPEGKLGIFERTGLNILAEFASGRPYTPLEEQDISPQGGGETNYGDTKGYVNSRYGPGRFRIDMKLEKTFKAFGNMLITPYIWIDNLLDADNVINVYRSTGSPWTTGYLNTAKGKAVADSKPYPDLFRADYTTLERNPDNFGIPRMIKLGLKVNFSGIKF